MILKLKKFQGRNSAEVSRSRNHKIHIWAKKVPDLRIKDSNPQVVYSLLLIIEKKPFYGLFTMTGNFSITLKICQMVLRLA